MEELQQFKNDKTDECFPILLPDPDSIMFNCINVWFANTNLSETLLNMGKLIFLTKSGLCSCIKFNKKQNDCVAIMFSLNSLQVSYVSSL